MPISSTEQFLNDLERSNLLQAGMVAKLRKRIEESKSPVDAFRAAKGLVDKNLLTAWQARQLLAGRHAFYLGRYKLVDRIGKGGMGVVFKAQHAMMDRKVALKVMSHALLKNPRAVARFNREVKTAAALNHPNIIAAYDADAVGQTHFLVMEYADGQDLNQWLRVHGPLDVPVACECALQAAEGLGHAYRQGMVHRDIKPVNLIVTWNRETDRPMIKILDMGLARFVSEAREEGGVTKLGQTIGTPDYIAPEAASNFKKADIRADIFSLGCSLYKLLSGRLPFGGENTMEKLIARTTRDAPSIRTYRPDVSEELAAVLAKMLARDPNERYQTPAEAVQALSQFAASTTGQAEALEVFRDIQAAPDPTGLKIESDADSSLDEFIGDFASAPLRDDGSRPAETKTDSTKTDSTKVAPPIPEPAAAAPPPPPAPAAALADAVVEPLVALEEVPADEDEPAEDVVMVGASRRRAKAAAEGGIDVDAAAAPARPRREFKKVKASSWESPLLLWGSAALVLICFVGGLLWFYMSGEKTNRLAQEADADYKNGAYAQAIQKYDQFIAAAPNHPLSSRARVQRGMAKIRQAVNGGGDFSAHLELAQSTLDLIDEEKDFSVAKEELIELLHKLAGGVAEQAAKAGDPALIEKGHQALLLVEKYIDKSNRNLPQLAAIERSLALSQSGIEQHAALTKAIADIGAAVGQQRSAEAYEIRRQLLKAYPTLESDKSLAQATLGITAAERDAVKVSNEPREPETGEPASPLLASRPLVTRSGRGANGVDQEVVTALAGGSVFGLSASDGAVLWRRHLGVVQHVLPTPVSAEAGRDLLVIDALHQELQRVGGRDGKLKWRQSCGGPVDSPPVVYERQALVAAASGHLTRVDLDSGKVVGQSVIPQSLAVAPAVNARHGVIYQVADHSNLYILSASDGACREAFYLGHSPGTVATAPLVLAAQQEFAYVVVAENRTARDAVLRVLLADGQGVNLRQVQEAKIPGHVRVPPLVEGRMLHVASDRGALTSFDILTPDQPEPLKNIVDRPATSDEHVIRYPLLRQSQLLIADEQLTRYDFQPARGRTDPKWRVDPGDMFLQPLQLAGDYVFHARHRKGQPGVAVAASRIDDGIKAWETHLAAPVVAALAGADGQTAYALTALGGAYAVSASAEPDAALAVPRQDDLPRALDESSRLLAFADGRVVFSGGSGWDRYLLLDAQKKDDGPRWVTLPSGGALTAAPAMVGKGLVAPIDNGQVLLLDPASGRPIAQPFQPALGADARVAWKAPAAVGENEFVISDGGALVYRVGLAPQPQAHLAELGKREVTTPLATPLVVAGSAAFAADSAGGLLTMSLPSLEPAPPAQLNGQVAWGPVSLGDRVLLATTGNQLLCLDGAGQRLWQADLAHGPIVGQPLVAGESLLMSTASGVVWIVAAASGQEQAKLETGRPLSAGPVLLGKQLLLPGQDGALHQIAIP